MMVGRLIFYTQDRSREVMMCVDACARDKVRGRVRGGQWEHDLSHCTCSRQHCATFLLHVMPLQAPYQQLAQFAEQTQLFSSLPFLQPLTCSPRPRAHRV